MLDEFFELSDVAVLLRDAVSEFLDVQASPLDGILRRNETSRCNAFGLGLAAPPSQEKREDDGDKKEEIRHPPKKFSAEIVRPPLGVTLGDDPPLHVAAVFHRLKRPDLGDLFLERFRFLFAQDVIAQGLVSLGLGDLEFSLGVTKLTRVAFELSPTTIVGVLLTRIDLREQVLNLLLQLGHASLCGRSRLLLVTGAPVQLDVGCQTFVELSLQVVGR